MNSVLLSLAIVLLGIGATLSAPLESRHGGHRRRPETKDEQRTYLRRFGHWRGPKSISDDTEDDFRKSLKAFQRFAGLRDTGEVDDDTMELMSTPRCGIPDDNDTPGRRRRFIKSGSKWRKMALSYFIENFTPDLPAGLTKNIIAKATKFWSDSSPLTISESQTSQADMKLRFASGYHGDEAPFDGVGGVLAHAFFPPEGKVHFDEDETWSDGSQLGTNLLSVATHEFGHALGLAHSQMRSSVMYPYYIAYNPNFALQTDDINGIQAIYGKPVPTALPAVSVPLSSLFSGFSNPSASNISTTTTTTIRPETKPTASNISTTTTTTIRPETKPTVLTDPRSTTRIDTRPTTRIDVRTTTRTTTTRRPPRRCSFWERWFRRC